MNNNIEKIEKSEKYLINLINKYMSTNHKCLHHKDYYDSYDLSITGSSILNDFLPIIEYEKIDKNGNSNWKKGNLWWKKSIRIPIRRERGILKYNTQYFWMKSNLNYTSYIIIYGKCIEFLPQTHFHQKINNYGRNETRLIKGEEVREGDIFFVVSGDDLVNGKGGLYDVSLLECLFFIEQKLNIRFIDNKFRGRKNELGYY